MIEVVESKAIEFLRKLPTTSVDLIYIDPPFNTGKRQKTDFDAGYMDKYVDYESFLKPHLIEAHRVLSDTGSILVHCDWHESHYIKVWLDGIFGRSNFRNEIIYYSEIGNAEKLNWAKKYTNILWYSKSKVYTFNTDKVPTIPRKSPKPGYPETKKWTNVWNYNFSTTHPERVPYPNQKPLAILDPLVLVHSNKEDVLLDFFAGSGSFGVAAVRHSRNIILVDNNPEAMRLIRQRLEMTV